MTPHVEAARVWHVQRLQWKRKVVVEVVALHYLILPVERLAVLRFPALLLRCVLLRLLSLQHLLVQGRLEPLANLMSQSLASNVVVVLRRKGSPGRRRSPKSKDSLIVDAAPLFLSKVKAQRERVTHTDVLVPGVPPLVDNVVVLRGVVGARDASGVNDRRFGCG